MRREPRKLRIRRAKLCLSFSTILLASLGVGQLSELVHTLFVSHQTCAEHGELVDSSRKSGSSSKPAGEPSFASRNGEERHTHDHCALAHLSDYGAVLDVDPQRAIILVDRDLTGSGLDLRRPISILDLAPKQSPPPLS